MNFLKKIFKRKEFTGDAQNSSELKRVLGPFDLIMMGIGAIVGAGIFVVTGTAASAAAGPAVALSFLVAGLSCTASGLCYGELSTMVPLSGGAYTYNYVVFGEIVAWLMGFLASIGYMLVVALVASGWSGYFVSALNALGCDLDPEMCHAFGSLVTNLAGESTTAVINLPATALILVASIVLYFGIELSTLINTIVVTVKMLVLAVFVAIGVFHIDINNWIPFIPENKGEWGAFGVSGIFSGAALIFTAFNGYDAVAYAAQETKDPQRNLPIGIIGSLIISAITYMLCALVLTGLVNYKELGVAQPIALAVSAMNMPSFAFIIKIGAVIGLSSVVLIMTYSVVRMFFAMVQDGLLPHWLGACHPKHKTPHLLTLIVSSTIIIITNFLQLAHLVQLSNMCIITVTISVCLATIYGRKIYPEAKREFHCPMVPWVPGAGIAMLIYLLCIMPDKSVYAQYITMIAVIIAMFFIIPKKKNVQKEEKIIDMS